MVDNCKHVSRIKPCMGLGILSPENWNCSVCSTTESVWACLHCQHVACGRYNEEHALKHHNETGHPLSIEVNEKFVFCYVCDDYILNDNAAGDVKLLRMALDAVALQNFSSLPGSTLRNRILRSHAANPRQKARNLLQADLAYTALTLHRRSVLAWVLRLWRTAYRRRRPEAAVAAESAPPARAASPEPKCLLPQGTTGLRNLGNTCYINSIVQILSHTDPLSAYFIQHLPPAATSHVACLSRSPSCPSRLAAARRHKSLKRLTSTECLRSVEKAASSGLSGGGHHGSVRSSEAIAYAAEDGPAGTLCEELHALFRVLWSGRRAVVSPQGLLTCVWRIIPFFKGYRQQDAQEFLCELLDRLQKELSQAHDIVATIFEGSYMSTVRCLQCGRRSQTEDIFMDISLAFPESCHTGDQTECQLADLLQLFAKETEIEERSYFCETCNRCVSQRQKRVPQYSKARQQLRLKRLPQVLRLHLKRFRWIGRTREKICARVNFDSSLDVSCLMPEGAACSAEYCLTGVVVHHGRGFQSGHYTSFCYNRATDSWLHCNDASVMPSTLEEVVASQAYILFYTQGPGGGSKNISSNNNSNSSSSNNSNSSSSNNSNSVGSSSGGRGGGGNNNNNNKNNNSNNNNNKKAGGKRASAGSRSSGGGGGGSGGGSSSTTKRSRGSGAA